MGNFFCFNSKVSNSIFELTLWVRIPPRRGIQYYVMKFVSDLRQDGGTPVSSTKTDCHDITEILLRVALKHNNPTKTANITKFNINT